MVGVRRRGLLLAAPAVLLGACGGSGGEDREPSAPPPARPGEEDAADAAVLDGLLALEHRFAAVYATALSRAPDGARGTFRRLLEHERAHVRLLEEAIAGLGAVPAEPHDEYDLSGLGAPDGALTVAFGMEQAAVAAYVDALPRLRAPGARRLAAGLAATEAAHLAVVRSARGLTPVPDPFVA